MKGCVIFMLRICIISDYDSLFTFKNLGADAFAVHNKREVCEFLHRMLSGRYNVIYLTDNFFDVIYNDSMKYNAELMPKVKPIPAVRENNIDKINDILNSIIDECFGEETMAKSA